MTIAQEMEIKKLRKEIQDLKDNQRLVEFLNEEFLPAIGIVLGNVPYSAWPPMCRRTLEQVGKGAPMMLELYLSRLPTEEEL